MFARKRSTVTHNQISGLFQERSELENAGRRLDIEIDPGVDAALAEVAVERADIAKFEIKLFQIAKIAAELGRRDRRVFPAFPILLLTRNVRGGAEAGLPNCPDLFFFIRIVEELHGWSTPARSQSRHQRSSSGIALGASFAAKFNQQETPAI